MDKKDRSTDRATTEGWRLEAGATLRQLAEWVEAGEAIELKWEQEIDHDNLLLIISGKVRVSYDWRRGMRIEGGWSKDTGEGTVGPDEGKVRGSGYFGEK